MKPFAPEMLRGVAKFLLPVFLLFAAYLAAAGFDGPGGGFAGGLGFALAIMLYALVFGADAARATFPSWLARLLAAAGVLGFIALGCAGVVRGYDFLDYQGLLSGPGPRTQRIGVSIAEICILATTAGAFVLGFYALADRAGDMKDAEW
jgi:multicomponent Na+:H+ antiporter subunit B